MSLESMMVRLLNRRKKSARTACAGLRLGTCWPLTGGEPQPFFLPSEPIQHTFVMGRTGSGKTTALTRIQCEQLKDHQPFLNNDHHGASTDLLLGLAAATGATGLLSEPWSEPVNGFNPLMAGADSGYLRVQEVIAYLRQRWHSSWGPRLEEILFNTLLPLTEARLTLAEAPPFISCPEFRRAVLRGVRNRDVDEFWTLRFGRLSPSQQAATSEAALNKVAVFRSDPMLRCLVGQQQGSVDFDKIFAEGWFLLNNFSTGKLSSSSFLLAGLLMPAIKSAVYRRPQGSRPYSLFLDEFQEMVAHELLDDYLRSFRKFGCRVYLATQHLDLGATLKSAIFGNCTCFICFATSASDAAFLGREFGGAEGALMTELLPELKVGHAIVKIRGQAARLLRVDPVPEPSKELIDKGRSMFLRSGKTWADVDAEIQERRRRIMSTAATPAPRTRRPSEDALPEGYDDI